MAALAAWRRHRNKLGAILEHLALPVPIDSDLTHTSNQQAQCSGSPQKNQAKITKKSLKIQSKIRLAIRSNVDHESKQQFDHLSFVSSFEFSVFEHLNY